jgi:hypothetical protein
MNFKKDPWISPNHPIQFNRLDLLCARICLLFHKRYLVDFSVMPSSYQGDVPRMERRSHHNQI